MNAFWKRHLSWNCRFRRIDFIISVGVFWTGIIILNQIYGSSYNSYSDVGKIIFYLLIAYLVLAASKRCRDLDMEPWIALLMVMCLPCGIYLACGRGTAGPNKYGPDPRSKSNEPTVSKAPPPTVVP
jgi:uncharacterized membrane protein YhaH (DUF805 family)